MTPKQEVAQRKRRHELASNEPYRKAGFDEKAQVFLRRLFVQGQRVIERVKAARDLEWAKRFEESAKKHTEAAEAELEKS